MYAVDVTEVTIGQGPGRFFLRLGALPTADIREAYQTTNEQTAQGLADVEAGVVVEVESVE